MLPTTARAFLLSAAPALLAAANYNGTWDANIFPGNDPVAFKMEVTESPAKVCFFEDNQPMCSTSAKLADGKLVAQWDYFKTELRLEPSDKGIAGVYHSFRSNRDMKVEARTHQNPPAPAQPPAKLDGEWELRIVGNEKAPTYQLLFQQSGADIKGTVLRVDGDEGTMVGRVEGTHFAMSHFSGDRPTTLTGELKPDGSIEITRGATKAVALRPDEARARKLPPPLDPATHARAKNPDEAFRFSFPDLNGRPVSEANFRGKPYIVTVTGSWCPNCRDEAPFLAELYERYHGKGLEIAALCFEDASDTEHVQLRAFIKKFGMQYPALLAGEPNAETLKSAVPQMENLTAYPSSIYVGRDGKVRAVHTGFPGPGSGEELARVKREIRDLVEHMLAEPAR